MKYLAVVILFFSTYFGSIELLNNDLFQDSKTIIVYGSDTCHYCIDTKTYLKEKQIDFTYYDVDVNLEKQREMLIKLQKAGFSVDNLSLPVVDLGGKLIMNTPTDFEGFLKKIITKNSKDENN
ncbi:glutaredoxin family protein [Thalassobellus citreus]|uniref:glutaredoxin family protein n=1 Tax=Thalassobellus citreus TaxID=3367752 RepID=UPI0037A80E25